MRRRSRKPEPSGPAVARAVHVTARGGPFSGVDPRTLRRRAEKMLAALDLDAVELSLALVDDAEMRALNREFRGQDRPTDVLAFSFSESEPAPTITGEPEPLGDVVISVPTASRQARRRRRPVLDELTMLLAHGLLHLLGYDHQSDAEEQIMSARTRELEAAAARRSLP